MRQPYAAPRKVIPPRLQCRSSSLHKGPSSRLPSSSQRAVANSMLLRSVNPDWRQSAGTFLERRGGGNRAVSLATKLSTNFRELAHSRRTSNSTVFFYPEKSRVFSRCRRRHQKWFSLASFHHGSCNPTLQRDVLLFPFACSRRIWKIRSEVDDLERVHNRARVNCPRSNWRNSPDCRARAERAISSFYRGETWKIRSRWATRSNFQLPPRDIGRRVKRNASLAGKIPFAHEFSHRRRTRLSSWAVSHPRTTALFPLSLNFHAHFGEPEHSVSLPHEIFSLIRGEAFAKFLTKFNTRDIKDAGLFISLRYSDWRWSCEIRRGYTSKLHPRFKSVFDQCRSVARDALNRSKLSYSSSPTVTNTLSLSLFFSPFLSLSSSKRPSLHGRARHTVAPYDRPQLRARPFAPTKAATTHPTLLDHPTMCHCVGDPLLAPLFRQSRPTLPSFFGWRVADSFHKGAGHKTHEGGRKGCWIAGNGRRFRPHDAHVHVERESRAGDGDLEFVFAAPDLSSRVSASGRPFVIPMIPWLLDLVYENIYLLFSPPPDSEIFI